ncbi:MAG TPA: cytochrome c oxidase subunit 2A [Trueperaceae bacterium]|nr:cytochrome c oxidase subunit 2A [Trueperaceae bacterium]
MKHRGSDDDSRDPKDLDSSEAGRPPDTEAAAESVGPAPTAAVPGGRVHEEGELPEDVQPKGAIMVTSFTAVVILVSWFAVLALFLNRG